MKKIAIVLIAVLLVLSMTSCQKDKSEEIISTYVEYQEGMAFGNGVYQSLYSLLSWADNKVDKTLTDGEELENRDYYYRILDITDGLKKIEITKVVTKSGKITGTIKDDTNSFSRSLIYKDAVIEVTYTDKSGEEEKKNQKATLTIDGAYSYERSWNAETSVSTGTYSYDFTINNKTYKVTKEVNHNTSEITSATVNGKDVNLTLLNAGY